jgi:hypothetical protein
MNHLTDQFPSPQIPTQYEVIVENQLIRYLLFLAPGLLISVLLLLVVLIAISIGLNFNLMNWLE